MCYGFSDALCQEKSVENKLKYLPQGIGFADFFTTHLLLFIERAENQFFVNYDLRK